jgi:hypothetical protein
MQVVGKFKEEDIRLDSLHMSKTYGGFLLGPSEKRMEECNMNILKDLQGEECDRLFGKDRPILIFGKDDFDLKKRLPKVYCFAWLTCSSTVQDPAEHGSHLILIWFQNSEEDPFRKLFTLISSIDWEKHARDFMY